jgi:DNA polymerase Ligase (LigD)
MPRFVVLLHETPAGQSRATHFDLMLEHGAVLRTWAIEKLPADCETIRAEKLPHHRLAYLDYEGEISGDRGRVSRADAGQYEIVHETDAEIVARLSGKKLHGTLTLVRDDRDAHRWRVSFSPG